MFKGSFFLEFCQVLETSPESVICTLSSTKHGNKNFARFSENSYLIHEKCCLICESALVISIHLATIFDHNCVSLFYSSQTRLRNHNQRISQKKRNFCSHAILNFTFG